MKKKKYDRKIEMPHSLHTLRTTSAVQHFLFIFLQNFLSDPRKYLRQDLSFRDIFCYAPNDPMDRERATDVLVDFCHPLLKLEKKLSCVQPSEENKIAYHGQYLRNVDF